MCFVFLVNSNFVIHFKEPWLEALLNPTRGVSRIFFFRGKLHLSKGQKYFHQEEIVHKGHKNFYPPENICPWGITDKRGGGGGRNSIITQDRLDLATALYAPHDTTTNYRRTNTRRIITRSKNKH